MDLNLTESKVKTRRGRKAEEKEGAKKTRCQVNVHVDFDRGTRTKTKGSLRAKLDSKVEQSEAKIRELKHQLQTDKSLTSEQKKKIRNTITA